MCFLSLLALAMLSTESLAPGKHVRSLRAGGLERSYHVYIPPQYDANKSTPVILAFHGGGTNAKIMAFSCGLNSKADDAGFIVVYPNGTGDEDLKLTWNSGGFRAPNGKNQPDDVAFTAAVIDDLAKVTNIDAKRIYATGMSNGGMMCYRLAAELSDRIAAIAAVSGTMSVKKYRPKRPVAVIHFHGTADERVPFGGSKKTSPKSSPLKSVRETIRIWARLNGCRKKPVTIDLPDSVEDGTTVKRTAYGPGKEGTEVIAYVIEGGGHTWPGRKWPVPWLGKTTRDISANELIWEFFQKHPMK